MLPSVPIILNNPSKVTKHFSLLLDGKLVETESAKIKSTAFCQIYVRQIFLLYSTMQT